jgi:hypothetical protein
MHVGGGAGGTVEEVASGHACQPYPLEPGTRHQVRETEPPEPRPLSEGAGGR